MKKMKILFGALATVAMVLSLVIPAEMKVEAKPDPYSYKIRVYAGKRGKFREGDPSVKEYNIGDSFNISEIDVGLTKDEEGGPEYLKYYVKGIKPSGSDLSDRLDNPSFTATSVKSDMDYVVVYGVRGATVTYTVRYVDNATKEEFPDYPSRTYEGNIGDKPIVPYLYIEGYVPQAYNLTMTLTENENIMTFYYDRVTGGNGGGGGGGDTTVYDEEIVNTTNTTPVIVPGTGGGAAGAAGGGGVTVVPGDGAGADAGADGGAAVPAEPQELIDLDDEEVPLANVPGSNGGGTGIGSEPGSFFVNMPPAVIVGIVSMAVLAVAAAWFLIFKRKKKGTDEDEQE